MNAAFHQPPRNQWLRLWSALPAQRLRDAADALGARYRIDDLGLCQSGLGLLPLRDGAFGEAYFLGEIPLAQAHVRISDAAGNSVEGAAVVLDDRAAVARALAILDGVLAARLEGWTMAAELLAAGATLVAEVERGRRALLNATRVDFSLLGSGDEDDKDE